MSYINKYTLLESQRNFLRERRQAIHISAEDMSVELGKSKAWLAQIERGKLFSIKRADLICLLSILYDSPIESINFNGILEDFLHCNFSKLDKITYEEKNERELLLKEIEELKKENKMLKDLVEIIKKLIENK